MLTGVVFLDLKKAFDTVDHAILAQKLSMYGIGDQAIKWFASYLTGRKQVTKVNGQTSSERVIKCWVPQGSILGPLLSFVYINDLNKYLGDCSVNLYADDMAVYCASNSYVNICHCVLRHPIYGSGSERISSS